MAEPSPYYEHCYAVILFESTLFDSLRQNSIPPPNAPVNLVAEDVPSDQGRNIRLTWQDTTTNVYKYFIARAIDPSGPYCYLCNVNAPCTSYTDATAQNNQLYYYIVSAQRWGSTYSYYSDYAFAQALDNITPPEPTDLEGSYLQTSDMIRLQWQPPSNTPDIAGYWVCPIPPGESDHSLNHASPIDRTIFYLPVHSTWQGPCEFFMAAMDYSGHMSEWSDPCTVYVAAIVDTSSSDKATA